MKLETWIESVGGAIAAARILDAHPHRVRAWLRHESTPNYPLIMKIVKVTGGRVGIRQIIEETNEGRGEK